MVQQQQIQQEAVELRGVVGVLAELADLLPQHVLPHPVPGTEVGPVTQHNMAEEAEVDLHLLAQALAMQGEEMEETDTQPHSLAIPLWSFAVAGVEAHTVQGPQG